MRWHSTAVATTFHGKRGNPYDKEKQEDSMYKAFSCLNAGRWIGSWVWVCLGKLFQQQRFGQLFFSASDLKNGAHIGRLRVRKPEICKCGANEGYILEMLPLELCWFINTRAEATGIGAAAICLRIVESRVELV